MNLSRQVCLKCSGKCPDASAVLTISAATSDGTVEPVEESFISERSDVFGAEAGAPCLRARNLPGGARRAVVDPQVACTSVGGMGREQRATAPGREMTAGQAERGQALDELFGPGFGSVCNPDAAVIAYEGCFAIERAMSSPGPARKKLSRGSTTWVSEAPSVVKMSVRLPHTRASLLASVR